MNLLELLQAKPLADLERMTDEELVKYFEPVLSLTRPENVIVHTRPVLLKTEEPKKPKKTKVAAPTKSLTMEQWNKLDEKSQILLAILKPTQ